MTDAGQPLLVDDRPHELLGPGPGRGVSLVVPTAGHTRRGRAGRPAVPVVLTLLQGILERTNRPPDFEVVVVVDCTTSIFARKALKDLAAANEVVRLLDATRSPTNEFNFSSVVNQGVDVARYERIVLVNDDIDVVAADWLNALNERLDVSEVGVVGALLLYEDGSIQHAGITPTPDGPRNLQAGRRGPVIDEIVERGCTSVEAVTGALLATSKRVWDLVGGFDEELPRAFNDVDFCLRVREAGWTIELEPRARLVHFETQSRPNSVAAWEITRLRTRWPQMFQSSHDPDFGFSRAKYRLSVNFKNHHDVKALAIASVSPGTRLLDVGCADGSVSRHFTDRGVWVCGLDSDKDAISLASAVLPHVALVDLEANLSSQLRRVVEGFDGVRFDTILCLDVLEHLRNPASVLRTLVDECLTPTGRVILSIPNIAHADVRLSLLAGQFAYTETGLLDSTHVRFFTHESLQQMLEDAGLVATLELSADLEFGDTEIAVDLSSYPPEIVQKLRKDPHSYTYQFFVIAVAQELNEAAAAEIGSLAIVNREMTLARASTHSLTLALESQLESIREDLARSAEGRNRDADDLATLTQKLGETSLENQRLSALFEAMNASATWRTGRIILFPIRLFKRLLRCLPSRFQAR